jgi:hypothetical protein
MKNLKELGSVLLALICLELSAQQVADTDFKPFISKPEYDFGKGPSVSIDEGHNNFHTVDGRYLAFARLLRSDGYNVNSYQGDFVNSHLKDTRILVIANAINKINIENWYVPTPSAFSIDEIETICKWVRKGGSLFLIADHMPFGGAASELASAFGFTFTNGFAADTSKPGPAFFYRKDGSLTPCSIIDGRNTDEKVNKVVTFTGQAMQIPSEATSILRFDDKYLLMETDTAWVFDSHSIFSLMILLLCLPAC